ncbi:MAG: RNA polymerase factor sigma-54 [Gammaproteobacteria bacterium]|nr:RNA polymerase factor sigma-54 [Gammaproteobacteria bacterium]MBU1656142.1 RNA polymerase factor sigma-54 [Gammaproteobacteria bacterium]MBU1960786.1 RNA polymerase factor sigma-54 [Gammaproteobacteria bacterium]
MKQSLQLRLGQQLTMTPQLQQAIRLLQLSVLELRGELQEAVESNPMLDMEEDSGPAGETDERIRGLTQETDSRDDYAKEPADTAEVKTDREQMPDELPVDTDWDAIYENASPTSRDGSSDEGDFDFLSQRSSVATLNDHLLWQLNLTPFSELDRHIAHAIIDAISEDGYLRIDLEEIRQGLVNEGLEVDPEEMLAVLHRIQSFDPAGVAARNTRECLAIQLLQLPGETAYRAEALELMQAHFDLLGAQDRPQIMRKLRIDDEAMDGIMGLIRSLSPRPGSLINDSAAQYIIPDVIISRQRGRWRVELNPESVPRLRIRPDYANLVRRADQSDDNVFLRNHLQEARWLLKSLHSRNETLLRVAESIVEFQRGFFEYGAEAMRPLVLRDVAEKLEMHESTISRVTTQKYMHTPRGTFEFKYFFSSHVGTIGGGECSATAIRALIKKLVAAENQKKPLSDHKLAEILEEQGIQVARRTVAKYRESLSIPSSSERKRLV